MVQRVVMRRDLIVFLSVLLFAEQVSAEEAPSSIAMVSLSSSQAQREVSERLAEQLGQQLSSLSVSLPAQTRQTLLKKGGQSALRQAARKAAQARKSLRAFDDLNKTARLLEEAADAHLDQLPLLRTLDEPVQLFVEIATVELARGDQEKLARALESAARLDPSFDLDPQEVSPRMVRAARQARTKVSAEPLLSQDRARRLGQRLGVEALILLQPRPGPQRVLVEQYRTSSGARSQTWIVESSDLSPVIAALSGTSQGEVHADGSTEPDTVVVGFEEGDEQDAVVFSTTTPEPQETPRPRRAWYRSWWFWTIIGVAVAGGAAAGIYFGLTSQGSGSDLTLEVNGHW